MPRHLWRFCITNLVDALHDCIERSVITDSGVCTIEVVVDCSRQCDARDVVFSCNVVCTGDGTVTADYNKCVNTLFLQCLVCLSTALLGLELVATACLEDCTSALDDITYVLCLELGDLAGDEAFEATVYGLYGNSVIYTRTCDGTYGRVHTWGVSS